MNEPTDDYRRNDLNNRRGYGDIDEKTSSPAIPTSETELEGDSRRHDANDGEPAPGGVDRTRAALATALHPVRMPDDVAARLRDRLASEVRGPGPRPADPPRTAGAGDRTRRAAVLLAAAAVVGALVALPLLGRPGPGPVRVAEEHPDVLRRAATGAGVPQGPAADPGWVRSCLTAAGAADPAAPLVAARPYPVAGEPGVLLVLGTPVAGRYRLVVVPPDCGPGTARILAEAVVP